MSEPRIGNVTAKAPTTQASNARRQGNAAASGSGSSDPFSALLAQSVESLDARGTNATDAKPGDDTGESARGEADGSTAAAGSAAATDTAAGTQSTPSTQGDAKANADPATLTKELVLDPALRGDANVLAAGSQIAEGNTRPQSADSASGRLPGARRNATAAGQVLAAQGNSQRATESGGAAEASSGSAQAQGAKPVEAGLLHAIEQADPHAALTERFAERFEAASSAVSPNAASTAAASGNHAASGLANGFGLQRYEAAPSYASFNIAAPLDTPAWPEQFGQVVRIMSRDEISSAELRVHPAELGPIEVRLSIEGDRAEISFSASAPETRALLEAHMPKLREAMESSGLQLSHSSVQAGPDRDPNQSSFASGSSGGMDRSNGEHRNDVTTDTASELRVTRRSDRMVDVFA